MSLHIFNSETHKNQMAVAAKRKDEDSESDLGIDIIRSQLEVAQNVVELSPEDKKLYNTLYVNNRTLLNPIFAGAQNVSARITLLFDFLYQVIENAEVLDNMESLEQARKVGEWAELYSNRIGMATLLESNAKKYEEGDSPALRDILEFCAAGTSNICIRKSKKYKDGVDLLYVGGLSSKLLGRTASKDSVGGVLWNTNPGDDWSDRKFEHTRLEKLETELSIKVFNTARAVLKTLFGNEPVLETAQAFDKIVNLISPDFNFSSLDSIVSTNLGMVLPPFFDGADLHKSASENGLKEFFSIVPVRTPDYNKASAFNSKRERFGMSQISPSIYNTEYSIAFPNVSFGIALSLKKEIVEYICQTESGGHINYSQILTWVRPMTSNFFTFGSKQIHRAVAPAKRPKFVVPLSKNLDVTKKRKELGMHVEEGKTDDYGIYIAPNGGLNYLPSQSERSTKNIEAYEKLIHSNIEKFEKFNISPSASTIQSLEFKASLSKEDIELYNKAIAELKKSKGLLLSYDWDYNTILRTDAEGNLYVEDINGSAVPDSITLADYLGFDFSESGEKPKFKSFYESFALMNGQVPYYNVKKNSYDALTESALNAKESPDSASYYIGQSDIRKIVDLYIQNIGEHVPEYYELLEEAKNSITQEYIENLYTASDYTDADDKTTIKEKIIHYIGTSIFQAGTHYSSAALRYLRSRFANLDPVSFQAEVDECPYIFDVKNAAHKIGNLYNHVGGMLLYKMCEHILKIPKSALFDIRDVPASEDRVSSSAILNHILPSCIYFTRYVPNYKRYFEEAETALGKTKKDNGIDISDIKIEGGKEGAFLIPHQMEAHKQLRGRPKFAILDVGAGGGKCVCWYEKVSTNLGIFKIGELWDKGDKSKEEKGYRPLEVTVLSKDGYTKTSHVYKTKGKTIAIQLKDGTTIEGLPEHRMWTMTPDGKQQFTRLDEINGRHYLSKTVGQNLYSEEEWVFDNSELLAGTRSIILKQVKDKGITLPEKMTEDLAYLMGYYVSEGCFSGQKLSFSNRDPEVLEHFKDCYYEVFNSEPRVQERKNRNMLLHMLTTLESNFIKGELGEGVSVDRFIPDCILQSPEKYQKAFLSALFEGDGYVSKEKRCRMYYTSVSRELVDDVKSMLDNMGIFCEIQTKFKRTGHSKDPKGTKVFDLHIWYHPDNLKLFEEKVGFTASRKKDLLRKGIEHTENFENGKQNTNQYAHGPFNKLPLGDMANEFIEHLNYLLSEFSYTVSFGTQSRQVKCTVQTLARELGHNYRELVSKYNVLTRYKVDIIYRMVDSIRNVFTDDIYNYVVADEKYQEFMALLDDAMKHNWVRATGFKLGKVQDVYDLVVPENHTYVVNGYLGHNTSITITDIMSCRHELASTLPILPLIICPTILIKNWVKDTSLFSNYWNVIPLNNAILNRWGYERMVKRVKDSPPNTITVVGNHFLANNKMSISIGPIMRSVTLNMEFLRTIGYNYIALDESHKMKKKSSGMHKNAKMLTTGSNVLFFRMLSATIVHDKMSDISGQTALYNGHIFRDQEFKTDLSLLKAQTKDMMRLRGQDIPSWEVETPSQARDRLKKYCALITFKKKHWAYLLPTPIETFIGARIEAVNEHDPQQAALQAAHQRLYDHVLNLTLEELSGYEVTTDAERERENGRNDEDEENEDANENEDAFGEVDDKIEADSKLSEKKVHYYMQRLEMLIMRPQNDAAYDEFFRHLEGHANFIPQKVRKVVDRIVMHFNVKEWDRGARYKEYDLVSYDGDIYVARKLNQSQAKSVLLPEEHMNRSPVDNPEVWKKEPKGKCLVICRYTSTVDSIYNALPQNLRSKAVRYHGQLGKLGIDKAADLEKFSKADSDKVEILIANEAGISEGLNLQMASRLIRVESPWGPGELEQTLSRVFRPDPMASKAVMQGGQVGDLYRAVVYLDTVIADRTMEVSKYARLISKVFNSARFDEADNASKYKYIDKHGMEKSGTYADILDTYHLKPIPLDVETLRENHSLDGDDSIGEYIDGLAELNSLQRQEFHQMRQTSDTQIKMLEALPVPDNFRKIQTPFITGQNAPYTEDGLDYIPFSHYMDDMEDIFKVDFDGTKREALKGMPILTDLGKGVIVNYRRGNKKNKNGEYSKPVSNITVKLVNPEEDTYLISSTQYAAVFVPKSVGKDQLEKEFFGMIAPDLTQEPEETSGEENLEMENQEEEEERRKIAEREAARASVVAKEKGEQRKENIERGQPINKGIGKEIKAPKDILPLADYEIELRPAIYHDYLVLDCAASDPDSLTLVAQHGFKLSGPYVYARIQRYQQFDKVAEYMEKRFYMSPATVRRFESLSDGFAKTGQQSFRGETLPTSTLPYFFSIRKKIVQDPNEIRPYPIIMNREVIVAIDYNTNPAIRPHVNKTIRGAGIKWELSEGEALYFAESKTDLQKKVRELERKFKITNMKQLTTEINKLQARKKYRT